MKVLALDTESNTWNKGSWSDRRHKSVCYSTCDGESSSAERITPESIEALRRRIEEAGIIVGFNLKYDLHVIRKLGIQFDKPVWCCQLAEHLISNQKWKYPSLDESLARYGLGSKEDEVAAYWKRGVQTEDIPWPVLESYAREDARLTYALYEQQQRVMSLSQIRLARLQMMDLLVLEEMEWNGLKYDQDLCEKRAGEIETEIQQITQELSGVYPDIPLNFSSGDDLSAFLYGGSVTEVRKEHIGFFKSGQRTGEPRYRNVEVVHELPRLVTPLPRSELKKPGYWATNKDTLLKLKPSRKTKHIIELIQRQTRLETLLSKSYNGIRKANEEQNWEPGWLHGQFNQVTVSTGRLSSSNPNMQNIDGQALDLFVSRYDNCMETN